MDFLPPPGPSRRVGINIPAGDYLELVALANERREAPATTALRLVQAGLKLAKTQTARVP